MEIHKTNFDKDIKLVNLGDVHRGDKCCNVDLFHKHIDFIKENEDVYWCSTGDLLNVALKTSLSDVYTSSSLQYEYDAIVEELKPISHKCLGITTSNHTNRFDKAVGMSLDKLVCTALNVPFLNDFGLLNITCGRTSYYVAMHHGCGGGRTRGAKSNELYRLGEVIPGCDLLLQGHTHAFEMFVDETPYIDRKRNKVTYLQSYFVCTGHYLNWEGSYAQKFKMKPAPQGSAMITLGYNQSGIQANKSITVDFLS